jgi:hypothetical protein
MPASQKLGGGKKKKGLDAVGGNGVDVKQVLHCVSTSAAVTAIIIMIELEARVKTQYKNLTRNQQEVTDLMLSSSQQVAFCTAREVGGRIGLSESTVIRLAYALEYPGFPALQTAVRERFLSYLSSVERLNRSWESDNSALSVYHRMRVIQEEGRKLSCEKGGDIFQQILLTNYS